MSGEGVNRRCSNPRDDRERPRNGRKHPHRVLRSRRPTSSSSAAARSSASTSVERRVGKKALGFKADVKSHTAATSARRSSNSSPRTSSVWAHSWSSGAAGHRTLKLDKPALVQILTQPRNAITRRCTGRFENVKLRFTTPHSTPSRVSARTEKIGARGFG